MVMHPDDVVLADGDVHLRWGWNPSTFSGSRSRPWLALTREGYYIDPVGELHLFLSQDYYYASQKEAEEAVALYLLRRGG